MSKFKIAAAGLLAVPALAFAATAHATVKSYIEGGDIFKVKNVTDNGSYVDPGNADACETVSYRVRLHNPGPDHVLNNVTVQASVPQATSTQNIASIIVRSAEANPENTSDTATLNLSSAQKLTYVNGSTQLLNAQGNLVRALPDGITGAGVNIGTVGISLNEIKYVRFEMKVSCPEQPKPEAKFECKALDVTKVDRTRFTFTARAEATNATIQSYTFTVKNSAGATVDTNTVNTSANSAVYNFNQSTAGTYTVSVIVKTDKGSTSVKDNCTKQITVDAQPVVQGKTTLPDTGPSALLGVFAGASALGTAAHYAFRRYIG